MFNPEWFCICTPRLECLIPHQSLLKTLPKKKRNHSKQCTSQFVTAATANNETKAKQVKSKGPETSILFNVNLERDLIPIIRVGAAALRV